MPEIKYLDEQGVEYIVQKICEIDRAKQEINDNYYTKDQTKELVEGYMGNLVNRIDAL